jgi:hypothetical protein
MCNGARYDASAWLEPIIEPDRWERLTEMLTDPARRTNPHNANAPRWLLSGHAQCGISSQPTTGKPANCAVVWASQNHGALWLCYAPTPTRSHCGPISYAICSSTSATGRASNRPAATQTTNGGRTASTTHDPAAIPTVSSRRSGSEPGEHGLTRG